MALFSIKLLTSTAVFVVWTAWNTIRWAATCKIYFINLSFRCPARMFIGDVCKIRHMVFIKDVYMIRQTICGQRHLLFYCNAFIVVREYRIKEILCIYNTWLCVHLRASNVYWPQSVFIDKWIQSDVLMARSFFSQLSTKVNPHQWGRGMGCLLRFEFLICILNVSLHKQYCVTIRPCYMIKRTTVCSPLNVFLPEASFSLRVLSLPASVCVCVCVSVCVRQPPDCPRDNSSPIQARITKLGPEM